MQTNTHTNTIERMLESADHHIEQHRGGPSTPGPVVRTPYIPEGWILYSAQRVLDGAMKGWNVRLLDTTRPFHRGSIVEAQDKMSFDAALREAGSKAAGPRRATA